MGIIITCWHIVFTTFLLQGLYCISTRLINDLLSLLWATRSADSPSDQRISPSFPRPCSPSRNKVVTYFPSTENMWMHLFSSSRTKRRPFPSVVMRKAVRSSSLEGISSLMHQTDFPVRWLKASIPWTLQAATTRDVLFRSVQHISKTELWWNIGTEVRQVHELQSNWCNSECRVNDS